MQHLDEGTIHAWLDGELPSAEREAAEAHAASCAECAAAVAEARGFIAASSRILTALDAVPGGVLPASPATARAAQRPPRRFTISKTWMAMAAVLVLGIGTVIATRPHPEPAALHVAEVRAANSVSAPTPQGLAAPADTARVAASAPAPARAAASDKSRAANEPLQNSSGAAAAVAGGLAPKASATIANRSEREQKDERAARRDSAPVAAQAPAPQSARAPFGDSTHRLMLSEIVLTRADTASSNDAADTVPRVLSRATATDGADTTVTTIYQVRGVRVSLVDRPSTVELRQPVRSGFSDAVMAKARAQVPAENSITWGDSTGRTRTLRGAMPQAELERLKAELFGATP